MTVISPGEKCPSCNRNLNNHTNQEIADCIKIQLKEFRKQEKEVLARYTSKSLTRKVTQVGETVIV